MKNSTIAATLNFIVPGSALWYHGKRSWGVANFVIAAGIVAALAGHPAAGERIHYVILAVAAGSAGLAHSVASRATRPPETCDAKSDSTSNQMSIRSALPDRVASFFRSDAFQSLDACHLIDTHRVRIKLSQLLGSLEVTITQNTIVHAHRKDTPSSMM